MPNDNEKNGVVAYFTPEIAIHQDLPFYSGGLGVLAGSMAISCKELGIPAVFISLLAREGYYDQFVYEHYNEEEKRTEYRMGIRYKTWEREKEFLDDTGIIVPININGRLNRIKVWQLKDMFNAVPIFLLDTDIPSNDHVARLNTRFLYGGSMQSGVSWENLERRKLAQYYILGKGGIKTLRRLGVKLDICHLNESHSYFAGQEIFAGALKEGLSSAEALAFAKSKIRFTTHTPSASGHGQLKFSLEEVIKMANINGKGPLKTEHLQMLGGDNLDKFNMTTACLRLAGKANAVSKKHLADAQKLWGGLENAAPIIEITNAVNHRVMQYQDFREAKTVEQMAAAKLKYKQTMIKKYALAFCEDVFTIGWGRRVQEYKRIRLLVHGENYQWLSELMKKNKIQVVMGGKPHPDDKDRIEDWEYMYKLSKSKDFPNLVVLPGYELDMMKEINAGVDAWLNTPRSPCEASGTSGMKGMAVNISIPDGWMWQANQENYFPFGSDSPVSEHVGTHDTHDADDLRRAGGDALTIYEHDRDEWYKKLIASANESGADFDSNRMVKEYAEKLYGLNI